MKITWDGETRQTNYGTFSKDDVVDLPKEVAEDFIGQGLASSTKITNYDDAERGKPPVRKRKTKEE